MKTGTKNNIKKWWRVRGFEVRYSGRVRKFYFHKYDRFRMNVNLVINEKVNWTPQNGFKIK